MYENPIMYYHELTKYFCELAQKAYNNNDTERLKYYNNLAQKSQRLYHVCVMLRIRYKKKYIPTIVFEILVNAEKKLLEKHLRR